jgi:hypothetical protein
MATVGFIHVPKCAGKAIHNTLSCGSNGFINLGHRAMRKTRILAKDKFSKYATDECFPPDANSVLNNGYLIKTHTHDPDRFLDPAWPNNTFDWAYINGFYDDAIDNYFLGKKDGLELDTDRIFASIRNPFTLMRSYWKNGFPCGWMGCNILHNIRNFEHFIDLYCDDEITWHFPEWHKNPFFQLYDSGKLFVPKKNIIRFENLESEIKRVIEIMGLKDVNLDQLDRWKAKCRGPIETKMMEYTPSMVKKLRKKLDFVLNEFEYDY